MIAYMQYLAAARARFDRGKAATLNNITQIYRRAAESVRKDIEALATGSLKHSHLSALAYTLERRAEELAKQTLDAIHKGVYVSSEAATGYSQKVLEDMTKPYFRPETVRAMFAAVNERAVLALLSRTRTDGLKLSDRVWRTASHWRTALTYVVEDGVVRGLDSRKLAREAQRYLQPGVWTPHKAETRKRLGVPKDVSYEAMRLARTELNNAFHEGMVMANRQNPGYKGIYWRLSPAHPVPDICDDMAADMTYGAPGFYPAGYEPFRPHPQCICTPVPAYEDPRGFSNRLKEWVQNPNAHQDIEAWFWENHIYLEERPISWL